MYNRELVAIIRKIIKEGNDTEFIMALAAIAADEIERLGKELLRQERRYGNPWIQPQV